MGVDNQAVLANLKSLAGKVHALQEQRMARVAAALTLWARDSHRWQSKSHTQSSIHAEVAEVTPGSIRVRLSVDQDAGLWLEMAHGGEWAWIWQTLLDHRSDIVKMLGGSNPDVVFVDANPDLASEYETLKAAYRTARASGGQREGDHGYSSSTTF